MGTIQAKQVSSGKIWYRVSRRQLSLSLQFKSLRLKSVYWRGRNRDNDGLQCGHRWFTEESWKSIPRRRNGNAPPGDKRVVVKLSRRTSTSFYCGPILRLGGSLLLTCMYSCIRGTTSFDHTILYCHYYPWKITCMLDLMVYGNAIPNRAPAHAAEFFALNLPFLVGRDVLPGLKFESIGLFSEIVTSV